MYYYEYALYISLLFIVISIIINRTILRIILIIFAAGLYISQMGGILNFNNDITKRQFLDHDIKNIKFKGYVDIIEETHPTMKNMQRIIVRDIILENNNIDNQKYNFIRTVKMTCSSRMLRNIEPMDYVEILGNFNRVRNSAIPGSFDQKQYNAIMNIDANGIVLHIEKMNDNDKKHHNIFDYFSYFRFKLTKIISNKLKNPCNGIASALLTGDKSSISPKIRENFIKSGTAHILAISGLHMSLVAFIVYFIIKHALLYALNIFPRISPTKIASFFTIIFTFIYLALSGFSPSATRAFIMISIFLMSIIFERRSISLNNIAISGFLILLFDPSSLFHVSFQLSFSAVVALIAFYERYSKILYKYTHNLNSIVTYIVSSILTTTIATLSTFPISIATFNRFSLQNITGNIIAIPITSFLIIPLGIINILLGSLTDIFIRPLEYSIELMIHFIEIVSKLPHTEIPFRSPDNMILYVFIMGGIIFLIMKTKLRLLGIFPMIYSVFHYIFIQKNPDIIFVPDEKGIILEIDTKNNKIYTNSKQKARNKIRAIQNNLGLDGEIILRKDLDDKYKKYAQIVENEGGLFIWNDNEKSVIKKMDVRKHPYCPSHYKSCKNVSRETM